MISTVIFDLDDTLYDEVDYCRSGFAAVARFMVRFSGCLCGNDAFACLWSHFLRGNRTRTFNAALEEMGIPCDDACIAQLIEVYRAHRPQIELPADSRLVLNALKSRYILALLTDGYLPAQRLKVEALGIEPYFRRIVYTEEFGRACWKPSQVGFRKLVDTLGAPPEQMVYVGDNEIKDFIAPNQMGMLTVQVRRQRRLHADASGETDAVATLRIDRIEDLPSLLVRY
jgi:putative hydrolase of the HAD superfamily